MASAKSFPIYINLFLQKKKKVVRLCGVVVCHMWLCTVCV
jgi:hypothetical protein